jgi:peptidoglycan biosynthesis protein MviN/MurJ (putative lipid II flippase)
MNSYIRKIYMLYSHIFDLTSSNNCLQDIYYSYYVSCSLFSIQTMASGMVRAGFSYYYLLSADVLKSWQLFTRTLWLQLLMACFVASFCQMLAREKGR